MRLYLVSGTVSEVPSDAQIGGREAGKCWNCYKYGKRQKKKIAKCRDKSIER